MRTLITLATVAGFAYGLRHFYMFLSEKNKNRLQEKKLEVWEGEGGAVPVAPQRTAAQVRPKKRSSSSSPGVG
jgi:hypothetical protein